MSMKCVQCGADLEDDSLFCPNCGAKCEKEPEPQEQAFSQYEGTQQSMVFCPNCGQKVSADTVFCPNCGQQIGAAVQPAAGSKKKWLIPAAIAAAVIVVVGIGGLAIGVFAGSGTKKVNREKLAYIKDDGLYYANLKKLKKDPLELTDELAEDSLGYDFSGILNSSNAFAFSKDGKYCYYPDRIDSDDSFRLMRKKLGSKKDSEKIDGDVVSFEVEESGMVIYQKKNGALYAWDGKEKTKLDSDVDSYKAAKEGGAVIWTIRDGEDYKLYYQKLGKKGEKKKLENGVGEVTGTNDDFSRIIIIKNEAVYLIEKQGEKKKLAGDILDIWGLNVDDLTFYYTVEAEQTMTAADYVTDDVGQDPYSSYRWDNLRENLRTREIQDGTKELYYYNGKEKQLISSSAKQIYFSGKGTLIYGQPEEEDIPKMRLSEINSAGDVERYVREAQEDMELYLAVGTENAVLNADSLQTFKNDRDKKVIYALEGRDEDGKSDLVSINYGKGEFGEIKTVDEDVESMEGLSNGSVYYYKDLDRYGYSGDLYRDGEMVITDVACGSMAAVPDSDKIVCITDGSVNKNRGTLTIVGGKKAENITDDVTFYDVIGEKSILMLTDYNLDRSRGDLKYYSGKEPKLVDSDVSGFFIIGNARMCP